MTSSDFYEAMKRSGLRLRPETLAELYDASGIVDILAKRVVRERPEGAHISLVFNPEQK